jgi:hypothetical protein
MRCIIGIEHPRFSAEREVKIPGARPGERDEGISIGLARA